MMKRIMKKILVLLILIIFTVNAVAQQYATYNQRGDEALAQKNYVSARMWYGEGLAYCDMYSIQKLTEIWLENIEMRSSMGNIMKRSFDCLQKNAEARDSTALKTLLLYYNNEIAVVSDKEKIAYWEDRLNEIRNPYGIDPTAISSFNTPPGPRMSFFAGYAFSGEMPFGISIGGIQDKFGWYVRMRTNFSFENAPFECSLENDQAVINGAPNDKAFEYDSKRSNKTNAISGSAGFIYKTNSWLSLSIGIGYGERSLLSPFVMKDKISGLEEFIYCHNETYSSKGILTEADAMLHYKKFYLSIGCNTINFDYVDLNAGIGIFF